MFGISAGYLKSIKDRFPKGARVECIHCADIYHPIESGEKGTVNYVDDIGTIHINWDNGRTLGICLEEDSIKRID